MRTLWEKVQPLAWSLYAGTWDRAAAAGPERARAVAATVDALLGAGAVPGERVLDLGCGTGAVALSLAEHGFATVALDASPGMLRQARRNAANRSAALRVRFARADFNRPLPLADGAVHHALCISALQCARDPAFVVGELTRVVAHGGLIGLATSTRRDRGEPPPLRPRDRALFSLKRSLERTRAVRKLGPDDLVALLEAVGAQPVGVRHTDTLALVLAR